MNALDWRYVGHCVEGEQFLIDGIDISDHVWHPTDEAPIGVEDPLNHEPHFFDIWDVEAKGRHVRFAAGEFSNCVWGFYRQA